MLLLSLTDVSPFVSPSQSLDFLTKVPFSLLLSFQPLRPSFSHGNFAEFCAPSELAAVPFNWRAPGLVLAFSAFFDASLTSQPFYPFCEPRSAL